METPSPSSLIRAILGRLAIPAALVVAIMLLSASPPKPVIAFTCGESYPARDGWGAAFFDIIYGGTCWSCPSGYNRTVYHVAANNACSGFQAAKYEGRYGCQAKYGSLAFFDPRNGGECWACPSGYVRTLEPVTAERACAANLLWGPWSRASYKGKESCDRGFKDPIDGGTCWSCPSGATRTVYSVKSNQACEVYAKAMNRGKFVGFQNLSTEAINKVKSVTTDFVNKNPAIIKEVDKVYKLINNQLKPVFQNNALVNAVSSGNYGAIWSQIDQDVKPILQNIRSLQNSTNTNLKQFNVMSISVSGGAMFGVGGEVEQGILIDFTDINNIKLRGFVSAGANVGVAADISVGTSIGVWKTDAADCGAGYTGSLGVEAGIASFGAGVSISPELVCETNWHNLLNFSHIEGYTIRSSVGVGFPIPIPVTPTASFTTQVVYTGLAKPLCTPCGGLGQRPCSLMETVVQGKWPSCQSSPTRLYEKCGTCQS